MSRALVVVESMFGNTREIAAAIAEGLSDQMSAEVFEVGVARQPDRDVELVVVGGPTHAFGMSRPSTRDAAAKQGASGGTGTDRGIREWLIELTQGTDVAVATFDTRIKKRGIPGSAARGASRKLRRAGMRVLGGAHSFFVEGTAGPLLPGELDRARAWGRALAERAITSQRA